MTTTALAVVNNDHMSMEVFQAMREQAGALIKTGFLPKHIATPEQAVAIALMGRELGVPMMQALRKIHVIQGTPCCAAELLLAMARRTGEVADLVLTDDGQTCRCTITRRGQSAHTTTFSMANAKEMQLEGKDNWRKQPKTMRQWRAISANLRVTFSDAIGGMYSVEEIAPDVEVDALGNPLDASALPGQPIRRSASKSKPATETPPPDAAGGAASPQPSAQPSASTVPNPPAAPASHPKPDPTPASSPSSTQPAPTPARFDGQVGVLESTAKTYQPPTDKEGNKPPAKKYQIFKIVLNGEAVEASCWDSDLAKIVTAAMEAGNPVNVGIVTNAKGQRKIDKAVAVEPGSSEPDGGDPEAA